MRRVLIMTGMMGLLVGCGEPDAPQRDPACTDHESVLACVNATQSCDWYSTGCEVPDGDGTDQELVARYRGTETSLSTVPGASASWFTVFPNSPDSYLGVLAVETASSTLVFSTDVTVTAAGAVVVSPAGLDCVGDPAPCDGFQHGQFGGRLTPEGGLTIDDFEGGGVDLRFEPHNGVKPAPAEQDPPPIDPDPIAGKYHGHLFAQGPDGFLTTKCSFVFSPDGEGGYVVDRSDCPLGSALPQSLRLDDGEDRFWFQLDGAVTLIGERRENPDAAEESFAIDGVVVRDDGSYYDGGPPPSRDSIPVERVAGTFSLEETGVER